MSDSKNVSKLYYCSSIYSAHIFTKRQKACTEQDSGIISAEKMYGTVVNIYIYLNSATFTSQERVTRKKTNTVFIFFPQLVHSLCNYTIF